MKLKNMLPIIIIELYLVITVLLYSFGPIEYNKQNEIQLYGFIVIYQLVFFVGYYLSQKYIKISDNNIYQSVKSKFAKKFNLFMAIIICISIFFSLMVIIRYSNTFNPIKIIQTIINSIFSPDKAYINRMEQNQEFLIGGRYITALSTLLSWLYYLAMTVGVYYFKKLNKSNKLLVIISIILEVLSFIIKGTNFGIFRVGIIIITSILLNLHKRISYKKININKVLKSGMVVITLLILIIGYFMYSTTSRMGGNDKIPDTISKSKINKDNLLVKILPDNLKFGTILGISYISQGYHGMALAFDYNFKSTCGIGNSTFLIENIKDIFGIDVYNNTYQAKMKNEWHPTINWHTAYTWFANDVSFFGVIIIMFILGIAINLIIRDAKKGNIIAIILLPLYIIMILFLPCNNVVLSTPSTFMPFVIWNFVWILSKKYSMGMKKES